VNDRTSEPGPSEPGGSRRLSEPGGFSPRVAVPVLVSVLSLGALPAAVHEQTTDVVLVARIAQAAAQRTEAGRAIATLQVFDGRLYVGYGDYTADTGPIAIVSIDLRTGVANPSALGYASDAVYSYRQIGETLFAPDLDPRRSRLGGFARGVIDGDRHQWTDEKPVVATHVFDIASFDGSDLWLFGSHGSQAIAWRTTDGRGWATALTLAPRAPDAFARLYSGVVLDGRLYTQPVDFPGGARPSSFVFDGRHWHVGPRLLPPEVTEDDAFPWRPQVVGRQAVYLDQHSGSTHRAVRVIRFDGTRASLTFGPSDRHATSDPAHAALDLTTHAGVAYVLNARQEIWSSTDLVNWHQRATVRLPAGEHAVSLAVAGSEVYVGTRQSRVYRLQTSSPLATR
jgi:hypothetical protein